MIGDIIDAGLCVRSERRPAPRRRVTPPPPAGGWSDRLPTLLYNMMNDAVMLCRRRRRRRGMHIPSRPSSTYRVSSIKGGGAYDIPIVATMCDPTSMRPFYPSSMYINFECTTMPSSSSRISTRTRHAEMGWNIRSSSNSSHIVTTFQMSLVTTLKCRH